MTGDKYRITKFLLREHDLKLLHILTTEQSLGKAIQAARMVEKKCWNEAICLQVNGSLSTLKIKKFVTNVTNYSIVENKSSLNKCF